MKVRMYDIDSNGFFKRGVLFLLQSNGNGATSRGVPANRASTRARSKTVR